MPNVIMGIPPFTTPDVSILATSSAQRLFPGTQALDVFHPALPWKATTNIAEYIDFTLGATLTDPGLALGWSNCPEISVLASTDGATWRKRTPNLLLHSHDPGQAAAWVLSNATVGSAGNVVGPSRHLPAPKLITFTNTIGGIGQTVAMGETITGMSAVFSIWAKAGSTDRIDISDGTSLQEFVLGADWRRIDRIIPSLPAGTTLTFRIEPVDVGTFYWGGAQATINTQTHPFTTYQTGANGLYIPINTQNGRRMVYLDLKGFSGAYGRVLFPGTQTPDDAASGDSLGAASWITAPVLFHGEQNHPKQLTISTAVAETNFESDNIETAVLGRTKVRPNFSSGLVAYYMQETLYKIARMATGNAFIFVPNDREPQGFGSLPDPSKVYFATLASRTQMNYQIPELMEIALEFAEIS